MNPVRVLLRWSAEEEGEAEGLGDLFGEDPTLAVAALGPGGEIPADLPLCDQAVILADWTRLAPDPWAIDRWSLALAPSPVYVLVRIEPGKLHDALLRMSPREVDDFIVVPSHPGYLARKVLAAFRYLTAQQGTRGLRTELTEQAADFREFHRVALALAAEADVDRLLELIVTKCREVTGADAGSLYLVEEQPPGPGRPGAGPERVLRFVVAQNDSRRIDLKRVALPLTRSSIAGYVALTRKALNLADVYRLPPDVECSFNPATDQALGYRTVSMLVIPMVDQTDVVIGVVQVINKKRAPEVRLDTPPVAEAETEAFGPRDEEMVGSLAGLAAVVAVKGRRGEEARRTMERQLRQAQATEAVSGLAGDVARQLENLVSVLTSRSRLLLHRLAPSDALRGDVELIQQAGERIDILTQQLLAINPGARREPGVLSLNEVVAGLQPTLRRFLGEAIKLEITPGPALGRIRGDPGQLEQVIITLALNAYDAMPRGGQLTLETANVELDEALARGHAGTRPGSYVMLAVRDTGVGMDARTQARLFEPFFTTKDPGKGAGLGLAAVYGIVTQHDGFIRVETQLGRGTVLLAYFPRVEAALGTHTSS